MLMRRASLGGMAFTYARNSHNHYFFVGWAEARSPTINRLREYSCWASCPSSTYSPPTARDKSR